jgi:hypothetical protein
MNVSLDDREAELKKRLSIPYKWGQRQNDDWDRRTNFVYHIYSFDAFQIELSARFGKDSFKDTLIDYALNRWFNFWSAKAVEESFCAHPLVHVARNQQDRQVDFSIRDIPFDHKTSIFPKGFKRSLEYAQQHREELVQWFYESQSQEQRKHLKNRIFIVLHDVSGEHWKLKAEVVWLGSLIRSYLDGFDKSKLSRHQFNNTTETLADVIWAVRSR